MFSCDFTSGLHQSILEAQDLLKKQDYAHATKKYESVLLTKVSPNLKLKIHFQLGEIYSLYLNQNQKALENFQNVIDLTDNPIWHVKSLEKIADINFSYLKNYKESLKAYKTLVDFMPTLEKQDFYEYRYAQSFLKDKEYNQAITLFHKIKEKRSHEYYADSYYQLGLCHFFLKQWKSSIKFFKEFIARSNSQKDITIAKFLIANAYETDEELKKAYNIYYSILNSYPNPDVIKNRLESLYQRRVSRKR